MNILTFTTRFGQDAQVRYTPNGKATISGEFKAREYESNGETRMSLEVLVREIELQGEPRQSGSPQGYEPANTGSGQQSAPADDFDDPDDLPF